MLCVFPYWHHIMRLIPDRSGLRYSKCVSGSLDVFLDHDVWGAGGLNWFGVFPQSAFYSISLGCHTCSIFQNMVILDGH